LRDKVFATWHVPWRLSPLTPAHNAWEVSNLVNNLRECGEKSGACTDIDGVNIITIVDSKYMDAIGRKLLLDRPSKPNLAKPWKAKELWKGRRRFDSSRY